MKSITKRYDFVLAFDVFNGNPNGDPDAGNAPRSDPETSKGLVSDVCLKRKIRNYVTLAKRNPETGAPEDGYDIYVKERAILNVQHQRAYDALGLKSENAPAESVDRTRKWMCQTFFDIRMFGAVMSTGINCGQVRGPVQMTFACSVDTIAQLDQSITRMAVTTQADADSQMGGNRTMGRKTIVPYGLYVGYGFISPQLATDTGFSEDDLELLWKAMSNMFELDRSAARGLMATRRLLVFEHENALGNAPAHALFKLFTPRKKEEVPVPRSFEDYIDLAIDHEDLKKRFPHVTLHEIV
jgi:CRISPR-associated protein Csd2